jgi:hypothetical protein
MQSHGAYKASFKKNTHEQSEIVLTQMYKLYTSALMHF